MEAPGPGLGPGSGSGARGPAGRRPPLGRRVRGDRGWAKRSGEAALGPGRSGGGRLGRSPGPREGVPRGNGRPGGGGGGVLAAAGPWRGRVSLPLPALFRHPGALKGF